MARISSSSFPFASSSASLSSSSSSPSSPFGSILSLWWITATCVNETERGVLSLSHRSEWPNEQCNSLLRLPLPLHLLLLSGELSELSNAFGNYFATLIHLPLCSNFNRPP